MKRRTKEEQEKIKRLAIRDYRSGKSRNHIVKKYRVSPLTLKGWIIENYSKKSDTSSLPTDEQKYIRLEEVYLLNDVTTERIRTLGALYLAGWTVNEIFQDSNVRLPRKTVEKIIKEKQWEKCPNNYIYT